MQTYFTNLNKLVTNFLTFFCFLNIFPSWILIRILNAEPDPGRKINADPHSTALNTTDKTNKIKRKAVRVCGRKGGGGMFQHQLSTPPGI